MWVAARRSGVGDETHFVIRETQLLTFVQSQ